MTTIETQNYQKLVQWGIDNGLIRKMATPTQSVYTMKRNIRERAEEIAMKAYNEAMQQGMKEAQ